MLSISSGPMMPSWNPGKFSTSVVFISAPPAVTEPSNTSGFSDARAVYSAAVYPAGPEPMMMTLRTSLTGVFLVSADCLPGSSAEALTPSNGSYGADIPVPPAGVGQSVSARGYVRLQEHFPGARASP